MTTPTRAEAAVLSVAALAVALGLAPPAEAQRPAGRSCVAQIGRGPAEALVRDCLSVDPAAPAFCRPQTPCAAMREMIAEACRLPGAELKPACADLDEDDDDDGDE